MTGEPLSRRAFLALSGGSGVAAVAGCVTASSRRLRFSAYDTPSLADDLLLADPTERRARFPLDYPQAYKRRVYDEFGSTVGAAHEIVQLAVAGSWWLT